MVSNAFIENIDNKPQINHKNGIKSDNRVENLEWCTHSENQLHAWKLGLKENSREWTKELHKLNRKKTMQFDKQNNFIKEWESSIEAGRELNINHSNISRCCNKKPHYKTAGGFIWRYKEVAECINN